MEFGQHGQKKARAKSGESRPTLVLSLQTGLSSSGGRGFAGCLVLVTRGFVVDSACETTFCPCETVVWASETIVCPHGTSVSRQTTSVWVFETTFSPFETTVSRQSATVWTFETILRPHETTEARQVLASRAHELSSRAVELAFEPFEAFELNTKKTHHGEHGGTRRGNTGKSGEEELNHRGTKAQRRE